jgi:hypothetical protein
MSRQDLLGGFGWRRCQHDLLNVEDACQLKNHSSLHYEENKSTTNSASALRFDGYVCGWVLCGWLHFGFGFGAQKTSWGRVGLEW